MSTVAINYVTPTEKLIAFVSALLLHCIVIAILWFSVQTTAPVLIGIKQSFEMVDLTAYVKQHQTQTQTPPPEPAAVIKQAEIAPEPTPVPEPEPVAIPVKKTPPAKAKLAKVAPPKPKLKPKPKVVRAKPKAAIENVTSAVPKKTNTAIQENVTNKKTNYSAPSSYAAYLDNPKPRYPRIAKLRGMEGVVKLRVKVGTDGRPLTVVLQQSSGFSALDTAAIKVVRLWRFEPARRGGIKVAGEAIVPIQFKLNKV
jgi:protein TonB